MNGEEIQNENVRTFMRDRYLELAALFKEEKAGSHRNKEKILAKFMLQEGATRKKTLDLFNALVSVGLVKISRGKRRWRYNQEAEWELFRVEI